MGFLRYFLAIIVVIGHSPFIKNLPKPLNGNGGLAVLAFFVISGFYMSLIKQRYELDKINFITLKNFYLSRCFRIYPLYYVCFIITLLLCFFHVITLAHQPWDALRSFNNLPDLFLYVFSNLFIFGQSLIRFFIYDTNLAAFIYHQTDNVPGGSLGSSYEILGQAWSLSIELTFYLLVPFILNTNKKFIFALCVASFLLRIGLMHINNESNFASDIFFPVACGVFLLGVLSHQIIYQFIKTRAEQKWVKITAASLIASTFLFSMVANLHYNGVHFTTRFWLNWWAFVCLVTLAVPFLFVYTKKSKWDNFLGELSYPVYMTHFFCIGIITKFTDSVYTAYYAILLSTVVSIVLVYLIVVPLDRYRHARFLTAGAASGRRLQRLETGVQLQ